MATQGAGWALFAGSLLSLLWLAWHVAAGVALRLVAGIRSWILATGLTMFAAQLVSHRQIHLICEPGDVDMSGCTRRYRNVDMPGGLCWIWRGLAARRGSGVLISISRLESSTRGRVGALWGCAEGGRSGGGVCRDESVIELLVVIPNDVICDDENVANAQQSRLQF